MRDRGRVVIDGRQGVSLVTAKAGVMRANASATSEIDAPICAVDARPSGRSRPMTEGR